MNHSLPDPTIKYYFVDSCENLEKVNLASSFLQKNYNPWKNPAGKSIFQK
jgi:hypothetical protein